MSATNDPKPSTVPASETDLGSVGCCLSVSDATLGWYQLLEKKIILSLEMKLKFFRR